MPHQADPPWVAMFGLEFGNDGNSECHLISGAGEKSNRLFPNRDGNLLTLEDEEFEVKGYAIMTSTRANNMTSIPRSCLASATREQYMRTPDAATNGRSEIAQVTQDDKNHDDETKQEVIQHSEDEPDSEKEGNQMQNQPARPSMPNEAQKPCPRVEGSLGPSTPAKPQKSNEPQEAPKQTKHTGQPAPNGSRRLPGPKDQKKGPQK